MAIQLSNLMSKENLQTVWSKINTLFVRKEAGKGLSANDFTDTLKNKLDGIDEGANAYTHPTHDAATEDFYKVTVDAQGHVSATAKVTKADVTALGIPAQDTTYEVMTGAGAEADGTSGLVPQPVAGASGRFLRADGTWVIPPNDNTEYDKATNTADGLMSKEDFIKLGNVEEGATKTVIDNAMSETSENPVQNKIVDAAIKAASAAALSSAKTYTDNAVVSVYKYIGSVADEDALNALDTTSMVVGSVYNIEAASSYGVAGMNVAWNGTAWDNLGGSFSISTLTDDEINAICV